MTSNLGSQYLVDPTLDPRAKREAVMAAVRQAFKPEFLNRLDEVVVFDPLSTGELARIVDLQVRALSTRLHDRRITLEVTDAAPRPGSPSRATTRPTGPGRCAGWCSARSATGWPGRCSRATSATATPSPSTSARPASLLR